MKTAIIIMISILPGLYGCRNSALLPVDYVEFVRDEQNGMVTTQTFGDLTYKLQFKPKEFVALQEFKRKQFTEDDFNAAFERYKGAQYFTFTISSQRGNKDLLQYALESEQQYYARVEYCSFAMQHDFILIDGNDSIGCKLFHFERTYGIIPELNFVLAFDESKNESDNGHADKRLLYNDRLFGNGLVELVIVGKNISRIPDLKVES